MPQYFDTTRKGQLAQLQNQLNSKNSQERKTAVKKVIAQMTVGKDLSQLFQDVLKCLENPDMELKKLVYLYIINYSRTRPHDALMSINLFNKDVFNKTNPIIRALAVRTMGCLRVSGLNQYLMRPLTKCLDDQNPYVRKTAVLCVPKVIQVSKSQTDTESLINHLQGMLEKETNSLVLANLVCSIRQIEEYKGVKILNINNNILLKLLVAINQCMEWGQVFIMDSLVHYVPKNQQEAQLIISKILPRLGHLNPSVVFGAIKVIIKFLDYLSSPGLVNNLYKKLGPSIVSLVSWQKYEIQFVLLKNIHYIIQKRSEILQNEYKSFFIKIDEPFYIKHEKMYFILNSQILVRIVNSKNYQIVLLQLKEYMGEADPQIVSRSIRAVGKLAVKFEKAIDKALNILSKYLQQIVTNIQHADIFINQLLIVQNHNQSFQTILRKYPSKFDYNGMFVNIIKILKYANSGQAKQAAAWINGQYAQQNYPGAIKNIQQYLQTFLTQDRKMQLEILTSAVKVFIKYPQEGYNIVINLLKLATQQVLNPDVRDRAYIYWRLLSIDPNKTKLVIFGYRPNTIDNDALLQPEYLNLMIEYMGMTSTLFQKKPSQLLPKTLADRKVIFCQQKINISQQQIQEPSVKRSQKLIEINIEQKNQGQEINENVKESKQIDLLQL